MHTYRPQTLKVSAPITAINARTSLAENANKEKGVCRIFSIELQCTARAMICTELVEPMQGNSQQVDQSGHSTLFIIPCRGRRLVYLSSEEFEISDISRSLLIVSTHAATL